MEVLHRFLVSTAVPLLHPFSPTERIFWLYLLSSLALAAWVYIRLRGRGGGASVGGFLRYCFPKKIYFHRSAVVDYMYFVLYKMLFFFLIIPLLLTERGVSGAVLSFLSSMHAPLGWVPANPFLFSLTFTLMTFVAADFGIFLAHYCQHKIPWLWEFHKVHHSAEVMTPITVYRMHPVDDILSATLVSLFAGLFAGLWLYCFDDSGAGVTVLGVNVFVFAYYLFGYNLRHSHIWLDYGPALDRILISPAQHQIHHSTAREHVDKNLGFVFSFWDSLFGSLVVPDRPLSLEFGLRHQEDRQYQSVPRLFFLPFRKCLDRLKTLR